MRTLAFDELQSVSGGLSGFDSEPVTGHWLEPDYFRPRIPGQEGFPGWPNGPYSLAADGDEMAEVTVYGHRTDDGDWIESTFYTGGLAGSVLGIYFGISVAAHETGIIGVLAMSEAVWAGAALGVTIGLAVAAVVVAAGVVYVAVRGQ